MVRAYRDSIRPRAKTASKHYSSRPLAIERLEDRLTPAALEFVPIAVVSVNPQPLPPSALIEFDPMLQSLAVPATAQTTSGPILIQGHLKESGQSIDPTAASTPISWSLDVSYELVGRSSETAVPPGPTTDLSTIDAKYEAAGEVVSVLTVHGPGGAQQTMQIDGVTVQGGLSGTISPPDTVSKKHLANIKYSDLTLTVGLVSLSPFDSWLRQERSRSSGAIVETEQPAADGQASSLTADFTQKDGVTACFMPLSAGEHPPSPCYQIDATFSASGSATHIIQPPGPTNASSALVQYQSAYSETVTPPPSSAGGGPIEVPPQDFMNEGSYLNVDFDPGR